MFRSTGVRGFKPAARLAALLSVLLLTFPGTVTPASGDSQLDAVENAGEGEPAPASPEETAEALAAFNTWATAFQARDYDRVWQMTDPRIRQWFDQKRWEKRMKGANRESGEILSWEIEAVAPVTAAQLPCTEMGHCFRQGVPYVFISLNSSYSKAKPPQPEFVVMAKSDEGWKFGGGTFPDTPMGETSVILDRKDESRYRYRRN